jgi:hypothetical protein
MTVQDLMHALLQGVGAGLGAEAEIEVDHHMAGNDVAGARAAMDIADLPAGGREEGIAAVPDRGRELGECGQAS